MKIFGAFGVVVLLALAPSAGFGQTEEDAQPKKVCIDRCGDGTCQEIVCLGEGCPCAETPASCSADCATEG